MMVQKVNFNPLSEVGLLKDYSKEPIRMHSNPLNEALFKKKQKEDSRIIVRINMFQSSKRGPL
jgi:hypothetical protein